MTDTISSAVRTFTDDPQSGRVSPKATATLANGRARVSAGPFNWDADLPTVIGGGNQAPTPIAYLLGSLAACAVALVADTLAPELGIDIEEMSATATCSTDLGGLVGVAGSDSRLQGITLEVAVSASDPSAVATLDQAWRERCPVYLALVEPTGVAVTFTASTSESASESEENQS